MSSELTLRASVGLLMLSLIFVRVSGPTGSDARRRSGGTREDGGGSHGNQSSCGCCPADPDPNSGRRRLKYLAEIGNVGHGRPNYFTSLPPWANILTWPVAFRLISEASASSVSSIFFVKCE
jgi:hypothetical protein